MILIYCSHITPRKTYIFRHIFKRILRTEYKFTSDLNEFVSFSGIKFSYGKTPIGEELFVYANGLLDEQGIELYEIDWGEWMGFPTFFKSSIQSAVPFDLFAASFYLITRYEEYLPQVKDDKGRFLPEQSLAHKGGFLQKPIIEQWVFAFKKILENQFDITWSTQRTLHKGLVVEVSSFFKYKYRNPIHNFRVLWDGLRQMKISRLIEQQSVLLRLAKDPYDEVDKVLQKIKDFKWKKEQCVFLFHLGDFDLENTGVSHKIKAYQMGVKHVADHSFVGLRYSFDATKKQIKQQQERFDSITHRRLKYSMAAASKVDMPGHYKKIIQHNKVMDFSMGYETEVGFRAGCSLPFYFYDLEYEVQTPLLIQPYAIHYKAIQNKLLASQRQELKNLLYQVDKVKGNFVLIAGYEQIADHQYPHLFKILEELNDYQPHEK